MTIRDVVRDMLDGRENDEQITVEVSLLWSLLDAPLDEERLARALKTPAVRRFVMEAWVDEGVSEPGYASVDEMAAAISKAYREDRVEIAPEVVCLDCGKTPDDPGVAAICAGWHTRQRAIAKAYREDTDADD